MRHLFITFLLIILNIQNAFAVLTIEIVGGQEGGQPIAIVPFAANTPVPQDIASIVFADLQRTGRFTPMPFSNLPARPSSQEQVQFPLWQSSGMPHLVIGRVMSAGDGTYNVEFQLFDVLQGTSLVGLGYTATNRTLRQVAHKISDVIYQTLTGERGIFSTRIAYVTKQKQSGKRTLYRLYVADSDGMNPQMMLESPEPIMSPKWSPDGKSIVYVSLEGKRTAVYLQDVSSGSRRVLSAQPGLNSSPSWSPDGSKIALSLSKDGNTEIYVMQLSSGRLTRMTNNPAIDTEPVWSPDGNTIAFTSDRSGSPQIYTMPANGGEVQRVTYDGSYNASPRFSPDGSKLAVLNGGDGFKIGVMDLNSKQMDMLSDSGSDQSPTFAPNGGMVLYGTRDGLAAVSADGKVRQKLSIDTGEEVRDPAWSPFRD